MILNDLYVIDNTATFNIKLLTTNKLTHNKHIYPTNIMLDMFMANIKGQMQSMRLEYPIYITKYINGINMESEITSSKCVMYIVKNVIDNKLYDLVVELKLTASSNYIFDKMFSEDKLLLFELIGEGTILDNYCVHNDYKITGLLIK